MVQNNVTDHTVEHGHSLEIIWDLPGAVMSEDKPPISMYDSYVKLVHPDGTVNELNPGTDIGIVMANGGEGITAQLAVSSTLPFPVGVIDYEAFFVSVEGVVLLAEQGRINITPSVSPPSNRTVRPWDMFNPTTGRASDETFGLRMATCNGCPKLALGVCTACGCVMKWKAKLARATCPLDKW